jgi:hypothetical protein
MFSMSAKVTIRKRSTPPPKTGALVITGSRRGSLDALNATERKLFERFPVPRSKTFIPAATEAAARVRLHWMLR